MSSSSLTNPMLEGMIRLTGGDFSMGSETFYSEERPVVQVSANDFWIDEHPVTNAAFARFVQETGYITVAEREPDPKVYPDIDPKLLVPGSLVFCPPNHPVPLRDSRAWWSFVPGASWLHPDGPESSVAGRELHPVVHVAFEDAATYARWAGKDLPSEVEWEYAARGGLDGATYAWGDSFTPEGQQMANTWQGEFPWQNLAHDGFADTSPVGSFPPNGYGLYDMIGNVWEWTSDAYRHGHVSEESKCCVMASLRVASQSDNEKTDVHLPRKVLKGGSYLCAPNYCQRYRPAARQPQSVDTSTSHIGFRCVVRED
jgi:formylglycine-generating enzyme